MAENPALNKIGIIAGNGSLPKKFAEKLRENGTEVFTVALKDITENDIGNGPEVLWSRIASTGKIIKFFKDNGVEKLVLIGGMKRPNFTSLIPDMTGIKLLNKIIQLKDAGDNNIFLLVIDFLESYGFKILGIDEAIPDFVPQPGAIGNIKPTEKELKDIEYGKHVATEIGKLDIGQAAIIQNNTTLGVEGIDGTDELINRCAHSQYGGKGAILVKMKKPDQDRRIDLPSIGPLTIERLHEKAYRGVALDAGNSLIIDKEATLAKADALGIFIYGI